MLNEKRIKFHCSTNHLYRLNSFVSLALPLSLALSLLPHPASVSPLFLSHFIPFSFLFFPMLSGKNTNTIICSWSMTRVIWPTVRMCQTIVWRRRKRNICDSLRVYCLFPQISSYISMPYHIISISSHLALTRSLYILICRQ